MARFTAVNIHASYASAGIRSEHYPYSDDVYISSGPSSKLGKLYPMFEKFLIILLLLSSMDVITALTPSSQQRTELKVFSADVDMTSVAIEASVYICGGILLLMRWRRVLRAARGVWPLLALGGLACLSAAWSVHPIITFRRSIGLLAATTFAIYMGERYSIKAFARLLAQTLCLMMVLVLLFYFIAPDYIVDHSAYGGAWKGLSAYKNTFGEHMAVALLLLVLVRFRRFSWVRYVFLFIAAGLLFLSRSATAMLCGVLALASIPFWFLMRGKYLLLAYLLVPSIFLLGIFCLFAFPEPIFQILGRDATLTGRTHLWATLLPIIANRPILGYGYAAFWAGWTPELISVSIGTGRRVVPIADNGYIDLGLSLGVVGVSLFLWVFIRAFRRAMEYVRSEPGFIGLWPVTYLCIFALDNICESALLTRGTFPFLVFAVIATSLSMSHRHIETAARTVDDQTPKWEWNPSLISH